MEELKYSFKHQINKLSHHTEDEDVEKVKGLRGIKNLFKTRRLGPLALLQELFKKR